MCYRYDSGQPNDSWRTYITYTNVCCSFVHALTGGYQTGQVFGMTCVMLPSYTVVVILKVALAARLGFDPNSLSKLMDLFFLHHIYVWCAGN
eukprot:COSAG01_NODE_7715_length_3048_cov_7.664324_6_plen_92_part_00